MWTNTIIGIVAFIVGFMVGYGRGLADMEVEFMQYLLRMHKYLKDSAPDAK
jgi:hypothetical protein